MTDAYGLYLAGSAVVNFLIRRLHVKPYFDDGNNFYSQYSISNHYPQQSQRNEQSCKNNPRCTLSTQAKPQLPIRLHIMLSHLLTFELRKHNCLAGFPLIISLAQGAVRNPLRAATMAIVSTATGLKDRKKIGTNQCPVFVVQ